MERNHQLSRYGEATLCMPLELVPSMLGELVALFARVLVFTVATGHLWHKCERIILSVRTSRCVGMKT